MILLNVVVIWLNILTKSHGLIGFARSKNKIYRYLYSANSLLLGVLNALNNGRLGAGWSGRVPGRPCLPLPFICLPVLFICLPSWVLVVGFPAGLSPTSFHLSPTSFHLSPSSFHLSPKLGACGRVPGWLVSHFLSFVSHFFSFVSQFFSFVSQAGCLWSGSRLACLPLLFICPGWVACLPRPLIICFPLLSSFVSQFFSFVSQAGCLWSGSRLACFPLPSFVSQAGHFLSFVSHFFSLVSQFFSFVSHACGRVPGWLVSHFLSFVSHFFSTVSHFFSLSPRLSASGRVRALFRWRSGVRPFPLMCALFRWPCSISIRLSPRSLTAGVRPFPLAM